MTDTTDAARVPLLAPDDVPDDVRRMFDAFLRERGNIPNLFRATALRPPIVLNLFALIRAVMGPGAVPQQLKECLAVRTSVLNGCDYCLASHSALARRHGATDAQLDAVARGDATVFPDAWRPAFAYADAVTRDGTASDDLFQALAACWTPDQIVEITSVIALFALFNRIALALEIPVTR